LSATVGGAIVPIGETWAVPPGQVEVAVLLDGKPYKQKTAPVAAGETHPFPIDVSAPVQPPPPTPLPVPMPVPVEPSHGPKASGFFIGAGVLGGIAVAGFAVGIPFGVMAKSNRDDFVSHCDAAQRCTFPDVPSDAASQGKALDDRRSKIDQQSLIATVGFVAGGIAAGGSITLLIVGATRPKASRSDQSPIGFVVGPGSIAIDGKF
jgi:hypothetical protein